jgi:hypothetical protein
MKAMLFVVLTLGEVLAITSTDATVVISVASECADEVERVKKTLSLDDFPCDPYPGMLFYYTELGHMRCGEPEPS